MRMRMEKNYIKPNIEVITPVLEREVLAALTTASDLNTDVDEQGSKDNNMGFEDDEPEIQGSNHNIWE